MRGSVQKKGSHYYAVIRIKDPVTGKWKARWLAAKSKTDAERLVTAEMHKVNTGVYVEPHKQTIGEFLNRWLADIKPNIGPRTWEGYEHIVRQHLIPGLGHIKLTKLKPDHIQAYYTAKLKNGRLDGKGGLSARTVHHHHVTLHDALKSAVRRQLLAKNPCNRDFVDPPRFQHSEMKILNEDGITRLLEAAKASHAYRGYYALFHLLLYTGLRRSEALALRWCDCDLDMGTISVTRTLHRLRGWPGVPAEIVIRQPKTEKGRRLVALTPSSVLCLKQHREQQEVMLAEFDLPAPGPESLVFIRLDNEGQPGPMQPDTVSHAWLKLNRKLNLNVRLHDCRHSHASLLLKQGVHPRIVQERLGHASVTTTLDTYSHVAPGLQAAAALRFDEALLTKRGEHDAEDPEEITPSRKTR